MDIFRTAYVYVRDTFAGELKETDEGYTFVYDKDYLAGENPQAVSLTLPMHETPYF
jgi:serine/threonine-protein kinase HipA